MENVIKLVIAVTLLQSSSTEAPREYLRERSDPTRNKSLSNHYVSRNHNEDKFLNERPYLTGSYREIRPGVTKEKSNPSNRDFYRKNYEVKPDPEKRLVGKWIAKEAKKDDVLRKANRDSHSGGKTSRKEYADSLNTESFSNREQQEEEKFASTNIFRHFSSEDSSDSFATTRQRKMKKQHGSNGFIPLTFLRERKPNIILILTDDQDVELGSLNFMPKTLRLLRDGGAEFRHAYVTTPMCCPSRSSLLTGMYVHNHNVFTNNENCSNIQWQQTHETRTFATYLSNAGYRTGYFGKYLNKYNGSYIPPGWREWGGLIMNSRYYNYSINMNGKKIKHGFDYYKDYYPDLIANDSIAFLRESKQYFSRKPVMLVVSFPAPHGPEDSAPQYSEMFFNVTTHHTPSYDYAPNPDKQWILRVTNKMQDIHKKFTDLLMTKRLQTLQSVDSAVERIYQELKNINELENTYIIYTSDHGYHLGQFGLVKGKSFPFEFDVRVPFLVRGPGIEPGTVVDDIVLNIDLAPTFLDLGGVELPLHMDGRSILRLLHQRPNKRRRMKWPDTFLIESSGRREIPETAVMKRLKQAKNKSKETQLLKVKEVILNSHKNNSQNFSERHFKSKAKTQLSREDPNIDSSEFDTNDEIEEENSEETSSLSGNQQLYYAGLSIPTNSEIQVDNKIPEIAQPLTNAIPKLARLALECQSPDLQAPCQPGQKWQCIAEGDKWRKYKCKFQGKCTCYTPDNFMYTLFYNDDRSWTSKINYSSNNKQSKFMRNFRKKRSKEFSLWDQISEKIDFSSLLSLMKRSSAMSRKKRETTESHISDILDDLEHELLEAEEAESTMNVTFSLQEGPNLSKCSVTSQGKVNCSNLVYTDLKVWKKSRDEIELKIKRLKAELEALKEIRKHLREKRPDAVTSTAQPINSTLSFTVDDLPTEFSNESYSLNYNFTTESTNSNLPDNYNINILPTDGRYFDENEASTKAYYPTFTEKKSTFDTTTMKVQTTTHKLRNHTNLKKNEDGSSNLINGNGVVSRGRDRCICRQNNQESSARKEEKELVKEAKRKMKEERLKKKERKLRKKAKLEKECLSERMNCFIHDNEHWRTPPFWSEGAFCFCMNANNNTYSCLRTINSTHNFLYCEFTTGFRTFYNLRIDPFEQTNRMHSLTPDESRYLSNQLADMKACKGTKECTPGNEKDNLGFNIHHHHSYNVPPVRGLVH